MSEAALEEVAVLSAIYCGEGECRLVSADDGVVVRIQMAVGDVRKVELSVLFVLPPRYPLCLPDVSVSSPLLSRGRCRDIRRKLLEQAAALQGEPMVHQLVVWLQSGEVTEKGEGEACQAEDAEGEEWASVLLLDHMRSRGRYVKLLARWTEQLQLSTTLLSGPWILILLRGARRDIKEFCHLLKTVKVDVDASGRKCKERRMKVVCDGPLTVSSSSPPGLASRGCAPNQSCFLVKEYQSMFELTEAFQEADMSGMYLQIRPSLSLSTP
ncbi:hypothetical protein NHX12_004614 [Muraenolepis orangiensis]|uniref:RWD domain-containing protein 3 n=1 Tax=Muraenolepis orangiensis TaxID=630683 RepID=A0A9Q0DY37_9TELE|nr:hypothetical protein NHX12_004614 [Muraenolepis orangiensis]